MARIQFINSNLLDPNSEHDVEAHSVDCREVARYRKIPLFDAMGDAGQMDAETASEVFDEYNADFIAEDSSGAGAWPITVFPCSTLADETTTLTFDDFH